MDRNFLSGGVAELQQARSAVTEANRLQAEFNAAMAAASSKEKDLESQKKYVNDKINSAIKERRAELKKTHDEQVDLANRKLREAEKKRRIAKSDAVQARITDETADLTDLNSQLKKEAKMILKENKMPGFCNTSFYYALFAPKRATDFLIFVLTVLICFGAIPNIVCLFLKDSDIMVKILVYLAVVVFFVVLYFLVFAISKRNTRGPQLERIREKRTEMRANRKQIKKRANKITKDKDESSYGLEGYDSEIQNFQQNLRETSKKREDALKQFDEETAVQIREEIQRENQSTIDKMTEEMNVSRQALDEARAKAAQSAQDLSNTYEVYLGKKNTSEEKIDGLISLIQEGKAQTIMEALDIQNGEIK